MYILIKKPENIIDGISVKISKTPLVFSIYCKYFLNLIKDKTDKILITKYIIRYICLVITFFCLKIIYNKIIYLIYQLLNNVTKENLKYGLTKQTNLFKKIHRNIVNVIFLCLFLRNVKSSNKK